ncbi:hypothetical protein COT99_01465 [Candidatus Falkowbacteria bacterium CG10_big_fil_rev_8_21_14_0_10_43_10]|uniref:DUF3048 domain-containing protein n=1 Tax=Candidatus Falkowbacteria bacterium CG10_big_fil_rev_8_21_14_0_10_43_10 TaxID=1974567 RepID=A0A2H0V2K8_9BACT|nr:MAG: hypothetical protein COT99_01465 [Candidatus Falkowbacteria bacterium CG10_big_fil_rev_8_21_14_0_10_43_10]
MLDKYKIRGMKEKFSNIKNKAVQFWLKLNWPKRTVLLLSILAIISLAVFLIIFSLGKNNLKESNPKESYFTVEETEKNSEIHPNYVRRAIDGIYVEPGKENFYPVAVMIDNDPLARPQSGLAKAQLVYEAKAESGITRFMALFADGEELEEIGPIRSARPYYVDWSEGYNALYVHVGGSPEALDILAKTKLLNLNEFYQGGYFWRSNSKIAPHNVYSSIGNFNKYLDRLNAKNDGYGAWLYKDEAAAEDRGKSDIEINYSVNDFLVSWKYDKENNEYIRYLGEVQHKDADGTPVVAKNIIIMQVKSKILDAELRRQMDTIGGGRAWYCLDGICKEGEWKKPDKKTREKIYNKNGEEVKFNAGTAWIEVIQEEGQILI